MRRINLILVFALAVIAVALIFTLGGPAIANPRGMNEAASSSPASPISPTPLPPTPTLTATSTVTTTPTVTSSCKQIFLVEVGWGDINNGLEVMAYLPKDLTIDVGDTVAFVQRTREPHTVTFSAPTPLPDFYINEPGDRLLINPAVYFPSPSGPVPAPNVPLHISTNFDGSKYLNSGLLLNPGDSFSVTFTKAGTYPFTCLVHSDSMKGSIKVNPVNTPYPKTQLDYAIEAALSVDEFQAAAGDFLSSIKVPDPVAAEDGTHTFKVWAGASDQDHNNSIMFMRFFGGENLTITAGDSVTWDISQNASGVPHTITFLSGGSMPDLFTPEAQASGLPKILFNPEVVKPSPSAPAPYSGSGYFNSGILITKMPTLFDTPQNYTLTFDTPGVYQYSCLVHDSEGMTGTITVLPK